MGALRRLRGDTSGATTIEISLVAAVLAVVLITIFDEIADRVTSVTNDSTTQVEYARGVMCAKGGCGKDNNPGKPPAKNDDDD